MRQRARAFCVASASLVLTSCVTINVYPGAAGPVAAAPREAPASTQLTVAPSPPGGFVLPVPINSPRPIDTTWTAAPSSTGGTRGPMSPSSRADGQPFPDGDAPACVRPCTPQARAIQGEL